MNRDSVRVALAGDLMLAGRVGRRLAGHRRPPLLDADLRDILRSADLTLANLECCIVAAADGPPAAGFRAPPQAAEVVAELGIDCVSLANNHSGDAGRRGVRETVGRLAAAGVRTVGETDVPGTVGTGGGRIAVGEAAATVLTAGGFRLGVLALTDHLSGSAPTAAPPVAVVELAAGCPDQLLLQVHHFRRSVDALLVFPHWGPNWAAEPSPVVRDAAARLRDAGADLVVGHSAHVFHGAEHQVVFDLGGLHDDYPPHPVLRPDMGLLCLAELDRHGLLSLELVPVLQRDGITRLAAGPDRRHAQDRLDDLGTPSLRIPVGARERVAGRPAAARRTRDPGAHRPPQRRPDAHQPVGPPPDDPPPWWT